jgi:hypothetical protein
MNRDLIAIIVVFGLLALVVGISNSINVPKGPAAEPMPPEPVMGDIRLTMVVEPSGTDYSVWRAAVHIRNVAGHPLLLLSPKAGAEIRLVSGSSDTSDISRSYGMTEYHIMTKGADWTYPVDIRLIPSATNQTQVFQVTAFFSIVSDKLPKVQATATFTTPFKLDTMSLDWPDAD